MPRYSHSRRAAAVVVVGAPAPVVAVPLPRPLNDLPRATTTSVPGSEESSTSCASGT